MRIYVTLSLLFFTIYSFSQKKLKALLKKENTNSIPYISVDSLKSETASFTLLDSREPKEFKTSHIKNAICVGYDFFNLDSISGNLPDKDAKIIVYCSIGIRSEDIGEKLKKAGYTNVHNLYGGIFEWKNKGNPVYDLKEEETDNIHTFSKPWSKWLTKGTKIYD